MALRQHKAMRSIVESALPTPRRLRSSPSRPCAAAMFPLPFHSGFRSFIVADDVIHAFKDGAVERLIVAWCRRPSADRGRRPV